MCICIVLPGIEKISLIVIPSHKIMYENWQVSETLQIAWRSSWEVWNPAGTAKCIMLTICILPPPPHIWPVWCVERAIYIRVLRNNSLVHSVAVTRSCDILVLTTSSSSSSDTSSPFFILLWERVSWPFLGVTNYACSWLGPLAF